MEFLPDNGEDSRCEPGAKTTRRSRRNHARAFKAKVALAAMKGDETRVGWVAFVKAARTFGFRAVARSRDQAAMSARAAIGPSPRLAMIRCVLRQAADRLAVFYAASARSSKRKRPLAWSEGAFAVF